MREFLSVSWLPSRVVGAIEVLVEQAAAGIEGILRRFAYPRPDEGAAFLFEKECTRL